LDADLSRDIFIIQLNEQFANKRMRFLRLLGGGSLARADGPHRFVGNNSFQHLLAGHSGEASPHLRVQNFFGLASFAFRQRFTHAHDRFERCSMGSQRFLGDQRVGFLLILPPLRVAENHVAHGKFLEHECGDFARVSAHVVLAHVLRTQPDVLGFKDCLGH
jgi:hypothetical protein